MSTKLTLRAIKAFRYEGDGKSRDVRWDADMPGMGLRIYPSGKKCFVLSYRIGRTKRLKRLGDFGVNTLDQARTKARRYLVKIEEEIDPFEQQEQRRQQGSLRQLAQAYFADREGKGKKTVAAMRRRFDRNIPRSWLARRAASVGRSEIRGLHTKIGEHAPYEANRTLEILRAMYRRGISGALDDPKGGLWFFESGAMNPAAEIDLFPETKRKRYLKEGELPSLARQIDLCPNVCMRGALWCYLLIGARKQELLCARRERHGSEPYVDFHARTLELPDPKSGQHQSIPLSGAALAILQGLPEVEGNPYIFVGHKTGSHLVNIDKAWRAIRSAAGMDDLRLHDLRRSVGSWLSHSGVELNVIKHALRHASLSTTLVYARLGQEPARAALEEHGRRVMEIAGKRSVTSEGGAG